MLWMDCRLPLLHHVIFRKRLGWKSWFLQQLQKAIGNPPYLAISSNACKGIENAIKQVYPWAEHRECFFHLMKNFVKQFQGPAFGRMYPASRTYQPEYYEYLMNARCLESKGDMNLRPKVHGRFNVRLASNMVTGHHHQSVLWMDPKKGINELNLLMLCQHVIVISPDLYLQEESCKARKTLGFRERRC